MGGAILICGAACLLTIIASVVGIPPAYEAARRYVAICCIGGLAVGFALGTTKVGLGGPSAFPPMVGLKYTLSSADHMRPDVKYQKDARAVVDFINPESVDRACRGGAEACTGLGPLARPLMILPNPCRFPDDRYAALVCHEIAHIHGYRHGEYVCPPPLTELACAEGYGHMTDAKGGRDDGRPKVESPREASTEQSKQ